MAAILGNAVGAAGGVAKFFEGRKMQRKAQQFIENFEWKELKKPYKDLQASTLGSDLRREEAARTTATSVNALQSGGARTLVGGLGRVQAQNNLVNRQIAADLDQQQKQIDYAGAQDDVRIRAMKEKRQADELQGYGNMLNQGLGMKYQGIGNVVNAVGALGQTIGQELGIGQGGGGQRQPVEALDLSGLQQGIQLSTPQISAPTLPAYLGGMGGYGMGGYNHTQIMNDVFPK